MGRGTVTRVEFKRHGAPQLDGENLSMPVRRHSRHFINAYCLLSYPVRAVRAPGLLWVTLTKKAMGPVQMEGEEADQAGSHRTSRPLIRSNLLILQI